MEPILLSTTYFGPVQWYQQLHRAENVKIERWENFQKQTFRNRCLIAAANGVQALTVPVKHGDTMLIKDLRISDHGNWRHLHWNAIQSAYGKSPFFDYYEDDLRPFFEKYLGKDFHYKVEFQGWLRENAGKTYRDAVEAYKALERHEDIWLHLD